jgi:hypothetical protein
VGELEAVLGVGGRAESGGVDGGAGSGGEVEGEVVNLRERLRVVVAERDEALMLVGEGEEGCAAMNLCERGPI